MKFTRTALSATLSLLCLLAPVADAIGGSINKQFLQLKKAQQARERISGHISVGLTAGKPAVPAELYSVKRFSMEMPLDHSENKTNNETFMNKFWVYDRYYSTGGPVFLYHGAETNMSEYAEYWLTDSVITSMLQEFGGMGIVFEHRYYGGSTPQPVDLRYLTTANAIADVDYFAHRFKSGKYPEQDKTPKATPWILLGASYGGNLASFVREKYPETIFAAYSSSAPVQAEVDMGAYFDRIYHGIFKLNPACARNLHSAILYIDQQLSNGTRANAAIKKLFLGPGGEDNTDGDFADSLAFQFHTFQTSGLDDLSDDDDTQTLKNLCNWINTDGANNTSPDEGWEKSKEGKWIATRWASYPSLADWIYGYSGASCGGYNASADVVWPCALGNVYSDPDDVHWRWQYCTEWGYFQSGNEGPFQLVSKYSDVQHWKSQCEKQFEDTGDTLPALPITNITNSLYGGWSRPQPRTFYAINDMDPWSVLGFYSNDTDAPLYHVSNVVPGCEDKISGNNIFGYLLKDSYHAQDILGDRLGNDTGKPATDFFKVKRHNDKIECLEDKCDGKAESKQVNDYGITSYPGDDSEDKHNHSNHNDSVIKLKDI
ncbi:hypothetical protein ABW21_db0204802 [Orbilia brochopaga]|nr:hypothetical protein ABW21_db0204802 [Drechslerella brochopaga]